MPKLTFIYGTMNSGKSAQALMKKFEYEQKGYTVLLLKPAIDNRDDQDNKPFVTSRVGLKSECVTFSPLDDLVVLSHLQKKHHVIMVDEAQFCTAKQVDELRELAAEKPVVCYGLKTNFRSVLFEGSKRLLEVADKTVEFSTLCACGAEATMNARKVDGKATLEGDEIVIGGNETYEAMCYDCWANSQQKGDKEK